MEKNNLIWVILIIVVIIISIGGYFYVNRSMLSNQINTNTETTNIGINSGAVIIQNFVFSPPTLTINKGDTIFWRNMDSTPHTITSDSGSELDSGILSQGQIYSHTFNTTGTFNYYCIPHPYMKGTIIVM